MNQERPIYLDHHATTPVDPAVLEAMLPYFKENFGNPSSSMHPYGWDASNALNTARKQVADCIGAKPKEIAFTSGATEANNWVLQGILADPLKMKEAHNQACESQTSQWPPHIITTNAEHKSILEPFKNAQKQGVELTLLPVDKYGQIQPELVDEAIKNNTILVSVIFANNEVGTINPIKKIGQITKKRGVFFHTDATQAVGKLPIDVNEMGIDFLSLSAHKLYGPKGGGALFIRNQSPKCTLEPFIVGGGQERGLRSGTVNVPAVVGLGKACEIASKNRESESARLTQLRDQLTELVEQGLRDINSSVKLVINGHPSQKLFMNASLSFTNVCFDEMIRHIGPLAVSAGSACSSASASPSYVLKAIGLSDDLANSTLRIGLGRSTTLQDIQKAAKILVEAAKKSAKKP